MARDCGHASCSALWLFVLLAAFPLFAFSISKNFGLRGKSHKFVQLLFQLINFPPTAASAAMSFAILEQLSVKERLKGEALAHTCHSGAGAGAGSRCVSGREQVYVAYT